MNRFVFLSHRSVRACVLAVLCLPAFSAFGQTHAKSVVLSFLVRNNHGQETLVLAGLHEAATKGLDVSIGEQELPPVPPSEIYDVRLVSPAQGITLGEGSLVDFRPWPGSGQTVTESYRIRFQAGRTWPSVTLMVPPALNSNIKSLRVNNSAVKAGDSVVTQFASGDINISVEYTLNAITFAVSPTSLVFSLNSRDTVLPAEKTVRVTPSSSTALWSVSASASWITLSRTSGAGAQDVSIGVNHLAFESGRTSGEVRVRQSISTPATVIPVHVDMVTSVARTAEPVAFSLGDIYPNPVSVFGGSAPASLDYTLEQAAPVTVVVLDALGRRVRLLESAVDRAPGRHTAVWDLRDENGARPAAGAYLLRVDVAGVSRIRSVVLR